LPVVNIKKKLKGREVKTKLNKKGREDNGTWWLKFLFMQSCFSISI